MYQFGWVIYYLLFLTVCLCVFLEYVCWCVSLGRSEEAKIQSTPSRHVQRVRKWPTSWIQTGIIVLPSPHVKLIRSKSHFLRSWTGERPLAAQKSSEMLDVSSRLLYVVWLFCWSLQTEPKPHKIFDPELRSVVIKHEMFLFPFRVPHILQRFSAHHGCKRALIWVQWPRSESEMLLKWDLSVCLLLHCTSKRHH